MYKPHTFGEVRELVAPEVAVRLEDLKARLAELEELRELAQRELEALRSYEEE